MQLSVRTIKTRSELCRSVRISSLNGASVINEYRKIAEYENVVIDGMYSEDYGFMFSTWKLSKNRSAALWGNYMSDYNVEKQDFAIHDRFVDE